MYRVVGCRDCGALWIVADAPETTRCPRCGTRHRFGALHAFYETEDEVAAREARAALLAARAGHADATADLPTVDLDRLDEVGVTDEAYLEGSGLDVDAVAEAAERATARPTTSRAKRETVLAALDALDRPTQAEVVDYAADRDVPPEAVSDVLDRLVRAGEVTASDGRYRRV